MPNVDPMAKWKAERDLLLMQLETLRLRFHNPKQKGDETLAALHALQHSFSLATMLNSSFPASGDDQEVFPISVPLWALQHIVNCYRDYLDASPGRTLGEVFGVEGGGQGRRPAKDRLMSRRVQITLARLVHARRAELLHAGKKKEAVLDPNVFADVSIASGYGIDHIRAAWKKYRRIIEGHGGLLGKDLTK